VVPFSDPSIGAFRLGRFRLRGRDGWSARFVLEPGPDGEAAIDDVEELAVRMGRAGGLAPDEAVFVGVALREAIVNALRHGRSPDGGPTRIGLHLTPGCLSITVRDRGPGFDPETVPDPCAPENLCRASGRGIHYMRCFTDRVSFAFPRAGGSVVRLSKMTQRSRTARAKAARHFGG
jgi:serine/threonine-protein kinase RsbW